ncbi:DinB family protein [Salibacterium aidingense]|uniref:DinB family protein n=1 Tax=Salibacterium aidingense TaxID=384933 RepID=UPI000478B984|nr:DinB family protein [Salibacterium aidingense]
MKHQALQMHDYHVWANERTLNHVKELPIEIVEQPVQSVFSTIQDVFVHIHVFDHVWLGVMQQKDFSEIIGVMERLKKELPSKSIDEMQQLYREVAGMYRSFFKAQSDLDGMIPCEHPQWGKKELRLSEMVHHVVNHGTYHRGNITAMLRQMGHAGVPTDYAQFLFELER